MKMLMTLVLIALPAAAHAYGGRFDGPGGGHGGEFAPFLICAIIAALGYWVAQHAAKETANGIKRLGAVTGTVLVIVGLLGILCATGSHIKGGMARQGMCCNDEQKMMMSGGSEGEKGEMAVKVQVMKTAEPVQKKTK